MFALRPFREGRRRKKRRRSPAENVMDELLSHSMKNMRDVFREGFRTDIIEQDDRFIIEAELPGLDKDDIDLKLEKNILTISARHSHEDEHREEDYVRRERSTGAYQRSFQLENVKEDEISAEFENGILSIDMPKREAERKKRRTIDIN